MNFLKNFGLLLLTVALGFFITTYITNPAFHVSYTLKADSTSVDKKADQATMKAADDSTFFGGINNLKDDVEKDFSKEKINFELIIFAIQYSLVGALIGIIFAAGNTAKNLLQALVAIIVCGLIIHFGTNHLTHMELWSGNMLNLRNMGLSLTYFIPGLFAGVFIKGI